jgi:hypothetical protein
VGELFIIAMAVGIAVLLGVSACPICTEQSG